MAKLGFTWVNETLVDPFLRALNLNKLTGAIEDANTYYPAGGTANDLTISTPNGNYQYIANTILNITIASANTGAMTVNVDSGGATDLLDEDGNAISAGLFEAGQRVTFVRNAANTDFYLAPKGGIKYKVGTETTYQYDETIVDSSAAYIETYSFTCNYGGTFNIDLDGYSAGGATFDRIYYNVYVNAVLVSTPGAFLNASSRAWRSIGNYTVEEGDVVLIENRAQSTDTLYLYGVRCQTENKPFFEYVAV